MINSPWILSHPQKNEKVDAALRLFCFSFAGGSASNYAPWQNKLAPDIQVCAIQLPGRGSRFIEKSITDFSTLISKLAEVVAKHSDIPFAFFGHSLGGLIAFELSHYCVQHGLPTPEHIFVSGTNAPRNQPVRPKYDQMTDAQLIETLRNYDGTPADILENEELMELLLPAIRADFTLLGNYQCALRPKLRMPLTLLTAKDDKNLLSGQLHRWQEETSGTFNHHLFEGGHFYLQQEQARVLDLLRNTLSIALQLT